MKIGLMYKIAKKVPVDVDIEKTKDEGIKAKVKNIIDNGKSGIEHKEVEIKPGKFKKKTVKHLEKNDKGEAIHQEEESIQVSTDV
ncbi:MAG: hypothetical protein ABIM30_00475 [candidate division WOR-3 bacterium]